MRLLALDTASELCSAALWLDGRVLSRETLAPRAHAALILPMIDGLLAEAGVSLRALDAIAFGRGPGAFTGVRLAAAVAQGLGFAVQRPLIGVSDLRAMAAQAFELAPGSHRALICQDARMEEVYWACYERVARGELGGFGGAGGDWSGAALVAIESVGPPEAVVLPSQWAATGSAAPESAGLVAAGSGFAAYPQLLWRLPAGLSTPPLRLQPRAREVALLAAQDGLAGAVPAEQALPVYIRDRVTASPAGREAATKPVPPVTSTDS